MKPKVKEIYTKIAVAFIALWSLHNGKSIWFGTAIAPFQIISVSLGLLFLLWLVIPISKEKKKRWLKINIILLITYLFMNTIAFIGVVISD